MIEHLLHEGHLLISFTVNHSWVCFRVEMSHELWLITHLHPEPSVFLEALFIFGCDFFICSQYKFSFSCIRISNMRNCNNNTIMFIKTFSVPFGLLVKLMNFQNTSLKLTLFIEVGGISNITFPFIFASVFNHLRLSLIFKTKVENVDCWNSFNIKSSSQWSIFIIA